MSPSPEDTGETQQLATQWLSATNGWEAWRQLNLSLLSRFLNSLLRTSQDDQPASFWQHDLAWKERVVGHSELSKEESQTKRDQSCKQNKGELSRVNFPQNSRQQKQQQQKQELARRGKGRGTPQEKGEAYKPLPQQQRGKGGATASQPGPESLQRKASRRKREGRKVEPKGRSLHRQASQEREERQTDHPQLQEGAYKQERHLVVPLLPKKGPQCPSLLVERQPASTQAHTDSLEKNKQEERA